MRFVTYGPQHFQLQGSGVSASSKRAHLFKTFTVIFSHSIQVYLEEFKSVLTFGGHVIDVSRHIHGHLSHIIENDNCILIYLKLNYVMSPADARVPVFK